MTSNCLESPIEIGDSNELLVGFFTKEGLPNHSSDENRGSSKVLIF